MIEDCEFSFSANALKQFGKDGNEEDPDIHRIDWSGGIELFQVAPVDRWKAHFLITLMPNY